METGKMKIVRYLFMLNLVMFFLIPACDSKQEQGNARNQKKTSSAHGNSQQQDLTCRFIEGKYYIYLFFGEKAGFEKAWQTTNGVKVLADKGYPTLNCTAEDLKNAGFAGKVIGPYENKKRAKKSNRKLEMILREKEGWMHFYNTVCLFENGKCDQYK